MARYSGISASIDGLLLEGRYEDIIKMLVPFSEQSRRAGARDGRMELPYGLWLILRGNPAGRRSPSMNATEPTGSTAEDMDFDHKSRTLQLKGFAYLASKRIDEAERTAGELKSLIEKGLNRKAMRLYDHLMGAIELARNNTPKALEYLERAVQSLPYGPFEKDAWIHRHVGGSLFPGGRFDKGAGTIRENRDADDRPFELPAISTPGASTISAGSTRSWATKPRPARITRNSSTSGRTPTPACPRSRMPRSGWPRYRRQTMPKTKLGKWAGVLSAVFLVLLIALILGRRGLHPGAPLAIIVGMGMMITGIAAFITGVLSFFKCKDRSFVVILAMIFGFIAVLFFLMELVEGIIWRLTH